MSHLLVTNDFPPKVGGIQSYLWELWRRLDPASFTVLTTPYDGAEAWDAEQPFPVVRTRQKVLLPTPSLARRIDALAAEAGASLVVLDPALPLGLRGPAGRRCADETRPRPSADQSRRRRPAPRLSPSPPAAATARGCLRTPAMHSGARRDA